MAQQSRCSFEIDALKYDRLPFHSQTIALTTDFQ